MKKLAAFLLPPAWLHYYIGQKMDLSLFYLPKGKIWAESKGKDKGSTLYIELPTFIK